SLLASTPFPYTTLFRSLLFEVVALDDFPLDGRQMLDRRFQGAHQLLVFEAFFREELRVGLLDAVGEGLALFVGGPLEGQERRLLDRKSTRLNSSHVKIS